VPNQSLAPKDNNICFLHVFLQIKLLDLHSIFERKHMFDSILNRDEQSI